MTELETQKLMDCAIKARENAYSPYSHFAVAVVADTEGPCAPCGACRQVVAEFKIPIIIMGNLMGNVKIVTIEELLPFSFSESELIGK